MNFSQHRNIEDDFAFLTRTSRTDLLEFNTSRASSSREEVISRGGKSEVIGPWNGYDLSTKTGLNRVLSIVRTQRP